MSRKKEIPSFNGTTCQSSLIPGMCHFPVGPLFSLREWSAMKSLMKALTQEPGLQYQRWGVSHSESTCLLLTDWGRQCALISPHCAGGRCVNPVKPGADPGTSPVGYCTTSLRASQGLSPFVEADAAQICHQQAHYPPITFFRGPKSHLVEQQRV